VCDSLCAEHAKLLRAARAKHRVGASISDAELVPAAWRYSGAFWQEAGPAIRLLVANGGHVLILSGGYGLLDAREPIGDYDAVFRRSDWPAKIESRCLVDYCRTNGVARVVAFLAATTQYADVLRATEWSGIDAALVSIDLAGRRGAQQLVPRGLGQAVAAYLKGELRPEWRSSYDNAVTVTPCRP
jgi:hypothetical protein